MKADKACIDVAAGRAPADLVFKNVNVVNVFSEEIITADVAVAGGVIAGVGSYRGRTELDCTDKFLCPGFIDAHIHIESSLAAPFEFARAATRSGTTTIVADPHEIVNVCGAQAVQYLLDATENLPLNVYLMLPSSVPATPFETNGADFTAADMAPFMAHPRVLGLGEVMCYPDVLAARQTVLEKLALAADAGKRADGHAPGLSGRELQAYAAAGIRTEHECTTFAEAAEKLRAGLAVLVREGSAAKNLSVLVNGLLDSDLPADRFLFCTDDKHLDDIARDGPSAMECPPGHQPGHEACHRHQNGHLERSPRIRPAGPGRRGRGLSGRPCPAGQPQADDRARGLQGRPARGGALCRPCRRPRTRCAAAFGTL